MDITDFTSATKYVEFVNEVINGGRKLSKQEQRNNIIDKWLPEEVHTIKYSLYKKFKFMSYIEEVKGTYNPVIDTIDIIIHGEENMQIFINEIKQLKVW